MVAKHCCYALCKSDSRYPNSMPPGTTFISFPKPGKLKEGMDNWLVNFENKKTEKAKRWMHACGRKDFSNVSQITKDTYICSIHFNKDSCDPIIAKSTSACKPKKIRQPPKKRQLSSQSPPRPQSPDTRLLDDSDMDIVIQETSGLSFVDKSTQTNIDGEKAILAAKLDNKI